MKLHAMTCNSVGVKRLSLISWASVLSCYVLRIFVAIHPRTAHLRFLTKLHFLVVFHKLTGSDVICRDAESFASQKATRAFALTQEVMEKSQEVDHLREALNRSREALEIEKRLNKAIKDRKVSSRVWIMQS